MQRVSVVADLNWSPGAQQAAPSFPLLSRTGEKSMMKSLWIEIRTVRSLSNYHHEQNKLDSGKLA